MHIILLAFVGVAGWRQYSGLTMDQHGGDSAGLRIGAAAAAALAGAVCCTQHTSTHSTHGGLGRGRLLLCARAVMHSVSRSACRSAVRGDEAQSLSAATVTVSRLDARIRRHLALHCRCIEIAKDHAGS